MLRLREPGNSGVRYLIEIRLEGNSMLLAKSLHDKLLRPGLAKMIILRTI